jgi:hypothetical protein
MAALILSASSGARESDFGFPPDFFPSLVRPPELAVSSETRDRAREASFAF